MGGVEQKPVEYKKRPLKNTHPQFSKGWIVVEQTRTYIQNSFPIQEKRYEEWRAQVSKAAGYPSNQFSFLPHDMGYIQSNQTCYEGYALVNYPDYPFLLSDQIKKRQGQNVCFKEKQLYYLLYALVAVKVDAKQRGQTVGDIRPENIFINSEQRIKVGILQSFPNQKTSLHKAILNPLCRVLLAPEDLRIANQINPDNSANTKSEIFSIGATVLSAGTLSDLSDLYNYQKQKWTFSYENHVAKTKQWLEHEQYSEIFKSIVLNLINPDPEIRISLEELWQFLSKYQSAILAKEQFIVTLPPQSFELGVSIIRSKIHN